MVLGTTSGAGKSWLATALCRYYARIGLKVVPFKAQNMSNNARVVPGAGGEMGEIGSAQYLQALAARASPEVRMNPVLLKPERDTASQVVVLGRVRPDLAAIPWRERSAKLWPLARDALRALMAEADLVVIEGAGSPAEINLREADYVNMRTAREAGAACLLVTDIDRGGAFAHLWGTHQLLPPEERALIRGFVLNRFRGDAALLPPGPEELLRLTGVPTMAVLPLWLGHGLPEEDGVFEADSGSDLLGLRVAVVAYPRISNLDELQPLRQCPGVRVRWARSASEIDGADWVILPGSKHTSGDRDWLRRRGLDDAIARHARAGKPILGICGGMQLLGERLVDPYGVDGDEVGLGLLPLATRFERDKLLRRTQIHLEGTAGAFSPVAGLRFDGYEIRHGRTELTAPDEEVVAVARNDEGEPIGWQRGNVLGLSAHGLFESPGPMRALFGHVPSPLDEVFDGLADFVGRHFAPGALLSLTRATIDA